MKASQPSLVLTYLETAAAIGSAVLPIKRESTATSQSPPLSCDSVLFVSAMTAAPYTYFDSDPDSGYSLDHLAPAAPLNLQLAVTDFTLEASPEADFRYYWNLDRGAHDSRPYYRINVIRIASLLSPASSRTR